MKKIILAGGGHGHVNILKEIDRELAGQYEITLISDYRRQYYSGMLGGYIEGLYTEEEISFDVKDLCEMNHIKFVHDRIIEVNDEEKVVVTENNTYSYDFLSVNLGSQAIEAFDIDPKTTTYVKPIARIVQFKEHLDQDFMVKEETGKIIVVGGGAAGVEIALALDKAYDHAKVEMITSGEHLIPAFNSWSQRIVEKLFEKRDIIHHKNERAEQIEGRYVITGKNKHEFDYLVLSTGTRGPFVNYIGLDTNERNYLLVDDCLMASDSVIGMGDMVTQRSYPKTPKAGVFAIRQVPILTHNLLHLLKGGSRKDLKAYKPQSVYLQILNSGDKKGVLNYGSLAAHGHLPWLLKNKIDTNYMDMK